MDLKCEPWSGYTPKTRAEQTEHWGGWSLEGLELVYPAYSGGCYPLDLEDFTTSAVMLDAILQVAGKSWASDKCLAGLVRALNDILHPQANLCSGGSNKKLAPEKIRKLVAPPP